MKRVFEHPPEPVDENGMPLQGKRYWRSLGELENTSEFREWLEREFPQGAAELDSDDVSRRGFVKLMGASMALAGLGMAGCRRPEKHIVPFSKAAEWTVPGKFLYYASSMPKRGGAVPLIVRCSDGRPVKVEGNPLHPASLGGTDVFSQASVWDLYDPDRATRFLYKGQASTSADFEKFLSERKAKLGEGGGAGAAFLVEDKVSPTRDRLLKELQATLPGLTWCVYEPAGEELFNDAAAATFGPGIKPVPKFENAAVVLSLDSDFLGCVDEDLETVQGFSARRNYDVHGENMVRLYVVENRFTPTGGMADHRLRLPATLIGAFANALAAKLGVSGVTDTTPWTDTQRKWIDGVAADLIAKKGQSLVLVGKRLPVELQQLGFAINAALGNLGTTLVGLPWQRPASKKITELSQAMAGGSIHTLFILGGNPSYNAPANLKWNEAIAKVESVVRIGYHEDESSVVSQWNVPGAHYLESWGDALSSDGTYVPVQPMILPLFGGWTELDLLAVLAGQPKPHGPELIKATFAEMAGQAGNTQNPDEAWATFLRDGFLANSAPAPVALAGSGSATSVPVTKTESGNFEIVLVNDYKVDDGRYTNNAWLQEIADPITKLTWDNAALVSVATARKLGVSNYKMGDNKMGDAFNLIEIKVGDASVKAAALIAPGHADDSITLSLGYGREHVGRIGAGTGFNAYPLKTTETPYIIPNASVQKVAGSVFGLALTQEHHSMEGRGIAREATVAEMKKHGNEPEVHGRTYIGQFGMDAHIPKNVSFYVPDKLTAQHQWAMTVDMNICNGCNACVAACQAENNIPVVGKEQVINGREMHWIRIDRYFASYDKEDNDPSMLSQPMMCQQCDNAPCETVCPVNATVHSEEGLNVMAYNRCIGTRYCANNCPYKVRRFNYFDYNKRVVVKKKELPIVGSVGNLYLGPLGEKQENDLSRMQKNPNVTVRMRGVMEKCTFCVQRIEEAKINQLVRARDSKNTKVPTDSFQAACAQACTSGAIVFGDKADPESQVSKNLKNSRRYRVLEYLNVQPRVTYLARITNPNPDMPDVKLMAKARDAAMGNHPHGDDHTPHDAHPHDAHPPAAAPHAEATPAGNSGGHH